MALIAKRVVAGEIGRINHINDIITDLETLEASSGIDQSVEVFEANGTWTNTGAKLIKVICVGAGGGGAGGNNDNVIRAGGGGGGYTEKIINVSGVVSVAVTVGAGGEGGDGGGSEDGVAGGLSRFGGEGVYCYSSGGWGGFGEGGTEGIGGPAGYGHDGDINLKGNNGGREGSYENLFNGCGGNSLFGFGGSFLQDTSLFIDDDATGVDGENYGAGGSGCYHHASTRDRNGGDGTKGIVIVRILK